MKRVLLILALAMVIGLTVDAQRRITPVLPNAQKTQAEEDAKKKWEGVTQYIDEKGNKILIDTISGREIPDTTQVKKTAGYICPRWHAVSVGVNLWDPIMRGFGNSYGGGEAWVELSFHNRFKPIVAVGFGSADDTPDKSNYSYKSSTALYGKIGINYNFFYKSEPRYQAYIGLHYGFTNFSYDVTATLRPGYWDENGSIEVPSQKSTVGYGELQAGLRVDVYKNFAIGWAVKYHFILHESAAQYGKPWYIPGYGTRGGSFSGAINLSYSFKLGKSRPVASVVEK